MPFHHLHKHVLVPSLGISLFNWYVCISFKRWNNVLVPSLGISLFNSPQQFFKQNYIEFSSPLWGFLYLISPNFLHRKGGVFVLVPSLGISLFNRCKPNTFSVCVMKFSSPLWGFLYLIKNNSIINVTVNVLVPSLGISLFNDKHKYLKDEVFSSRPLSGDFFI